MEIFKVNKIGFCDFVEIKLKGKNIGNVILNIFGNWSIVINFSVYKGGRIFLACRSGVFDVNIGMITDQMMYITVKYIPTGRTFECTVVYGIN